MTNKYNYSGSLNKVNRSLPKGLASFIFTFVTITLLALTTSIQMVNALSSQDEIMDEIYEEADKINDI
jgi:hypothetical protein